MPLRKKSKKQPYIAAREALHSTGFFSSVFRKGYSGYPVLVFEKEEHPEPPLDLKIRVAIARFVIKKILCLKVSIHYPSFPKLPAFTSEEIESIMDSLANYNLAFDVVETWNGEGCYVFSVAIKRLPYWLEPEAS